MKPSEIVKIDEGIGDWFAKKGFLGRTAQHAAIGKQIATDREQASKQAKELLRKEFLSKFKSDLEGAINAGVVEFSTGAVSENSIFKSFKSFSRLIESKILNEAMNVEQYVVQYVKNLLRNYGQLGPDQEQALAKSAKEFSEKYTSPQSPFPEDIGGKLYDLAVNVKNSASGDGSAYSLGKVGYPKTDVKSYDYNGNDVSFDLASKKWTRDSNSAVITDPKLIDAINQDYYTEQKRLKRTQQGQQPAAPGAQQPAAPAAQQPAAQQKPQAPRAKPQAATNAMAQMTQQLTQPTKSSTGGTITTTQTGVRHTANPNNPNAAQPAQTNLVHKANPNNPNFKYANKTLH